MTSRTSAGVVVYSLLVLAAPAAAQPSLEKFKSPRATVRTLLTAVSDARNDPGRIGEAILCLDLSDLPDDDPSAGLLANRLEAILRAEGLDSSRVPDETTSPVYVLPDTQGHRIALRRRDDGWWLFDRETVTQLPKIWSEVQKGLQDKHREAAALNVSPEFASARAAFRTFLTACRRRELDRAARCLDLHDVPAVARQEVGLQMVHKLKQVLDRYRLVVFQDIPDANYGEPFVFLSHPRGAIEVVRQNDGDRKGEWLFSGETVKSLDNLFDMYESQAYVPELAESGETWMQADFWYTPELWLRDQLPGWLKARVIATRSLHLEVYELAAYVLLPLLGFGLSWLARTLGAGALHWALNRQGLAVPRETLVKRVHPAGWLLGVAFVRWGLLWLATDKVLLVAGLTVLNPLLWLLGAWALMRGLDLVGDVVEARQAATQSKGQFVQMLWPVGSLATKIAVVLGALFHLMHLFAWDVSAVLAGLGLGGLAFALGAQDSLKNIFGSFTLIADRPFVVGEKVKIGPHDEGVVEKVGLRSTRIRASDDTLLTVPNSNLTTMHITNYGRRRYRVFKTTLRVSVATPPERLLAFRDGIRELLRQQEQVRKEEGDGEVVVYELGESAIEVLVDVKFDVPGRHQELEAREALILAILRLAESLQIDLARPTQTLQLAAPRADGVNSVHIARGAAPAREP